MEADLASALLRLEGILVGSHAAIVPLLHRGIGGAEVERLLGGVGLSPTIEVATWFGWHDGAGVEGVRSRLIEVVPGGEFYDLGSLCDEYLTTRRIASEAASTPGGVLAAGDLWRSSWFPLLRLFGKGFLAVDLASNDPAASPVHIVWHGTTPAGRPAWPSLYSFVEAVIGRFDEGVYRVGDDGLVEGPTIDHPSH